MTRPKKAAEMSPKDALMERRKELLRRIEAGESLEAIARSNQPNETRSALVRAALVRSFDAETWQSVLAREAGPNAPALLRALIEERTLARIPGSTDHYRLPEMERVEWLKDAFSGTTDGRLPKGLADAVTDIIAHLEEKGASAQTELLYHTALIDRPRAIALFEDLYVSADRAFDRARCADLLRTIDEGQSLNVGGFPHVAADPRISEVHADFARYLGARNLWADDYYATGRTLPRPSLNDAFDEMLDDPSKWALQLVARGGMGKTTFLRWIIARRCVPAPHRIPCARIDFDQLGPGGEGRAPLALLLRMAEQLDKQLPHSPFALFISEAQGSDGSVDSQSTFERFRSILGELATHTKVVLFLDTCEEALLYQADALGALIERLTWLKEGCPGLRVVLSGRYDLCERLPDMARRLRDALTTVSVPPFNDHEARKYLVSRDLDDTDDRARVAIRRAEGLPFKLALLADLIQASPTITAAEIDAYPSVDLAYLIERVIDRIRNPQVQWLLRYGVVPRKLTFAFVRDVMARYLPAATAGTATYDDPKLGLPSAAAERVFKTGSDVALPDKPSEEALTDLWRQLSQFASGASWVAPEGTGALALHPDVLSPMRDLLRKNPVFKLLHEAAIEHYRRAAEPLPAEPPEDFVARRRQCSREIVYHSFQAKEEDATSIWSAEMEKARQAGDPEWQNALAEEATAPWNVDANGAPMLDPIVRCAAWIYRAKSAMDLAEREDDPESLRLLDVERSLSAAEEIALPSSTKAAIKDALKGSIPVMLARLSRLRGDAEGALELLRAVDAPSAKARGSKQKKFTANRRKSIATFESGSQTDELSMQIERTRAEALLDLSSMKAVDAAEQALAHARKTDVSPRVLDELRILHARALALAGKVTRALDDLTEVENDAKLEWSDGVAKALSLKMRLLLSSGWSKRASSALDYAFAKIRGKGSLAEAIDASLVGSALLRQTGDLDGALSELLRAQDKLRLEASSAMPHRTGLRLLAAVSEMLGQVRADALDLVAAQASFEEAKTAWERVSDPSRASHCEALSIELSVCEEGWTGELGHRLPSLVESMIEMRGAGSAARLLTAVSPHLRKDQHKPLRELLLDVAEREHDVETSVLVGLGGLALSPRDERFSDLLALAIRSFDSHGAVLSLLSPIAYLPYSDYRYGPLGDALTEVATYNLPSPPSLPMRLCQLDVLRLIGRDREALSHLESIVNGSLPMAHLRAALKCADRLGSPEQILTVFRNREAPYSESKAPSFGALEVIVAIEQAERLAKMGEHEAAQNVARPWYEKSQHAAWPAAWHDRLRALFPPTARAGKARRGDELPMMAPAKPRSVQAIQEEVDDLSAAPVDENDGAEQEPEEPLHKELEEQKKPAMLASAPAAKPERAPAPPSRAPAAPAAQVPPAAPKPPLSPDLSPGAPPPPPAETAQRSGEEPSRRAWIQLSEKGGLFTVEQTGPRSWLRKKKPVRTASTRRLIETWKGRLPGELLDRLASNWSHTSQLLGEELGRLASSDKAWKEVDTIALDIAEERLSALPFELLRVPGLGSALSFANGIQSVFRADEDRTKKPFLPKSLPPRVVVVEPSGDAYVDQQGASDNVAVTMIYERAAVRAEALSSIGQAQLFTTLERMPAAILHLRGRFQETARGEPVLAHGMERIARQQVNQMVQRFEAPMETVLTADALLRILSRTMTRSALIVVEMMPVAGRVETVRQLLLGNFFAAKLRGSRTPSVLAIGPGRRNAWLVTDTIARGVFAEHLALDALARRLRKRLLAASSHHFDVIPESLADHAELAVALFSDTPSMQLRIAP